MHVIMYPCIHARPFFFSNLMANDRSKGNLAVNIGEELLKRVNKVAGALGISQAEFVRQVLDEQTRRHKKEVDEITKREERIVEREKATR
jgi:hypothetical protein